MDVSVFWSEKLYAPFLKFCLVQTSLSHFLGFETSQSQTEQNRMILFYRPPLFLIYLHSSGKGRVLFPKLKAVFRSRFWDVPSEPGWKTSDFLQEKNKQKTISEWRGGFPPGDDLLALVELHLEAAQRPRRVFTSFCPRCDRRLSMHH